MVEYIDREKLVKELEAMADEAYGETTVYGAGITDAMDAVKAAPTADVRPALHAHWAHKRLINTADCSNCGKPHESGFVTPQNCRNFNDWDSYCPKCGAIMDEEAKP